MDADWLRLMELDPSGCFVTNADGQKVGTIVYTRFPSNPQKSIPSVAWISMVLVDRDFRNRGIGREMFSRIVSHLRASNTDTIRLDATDMGLNLYKKFGFREEYELVRYVRAKSHKAKMGWDIPDAPIDLVRIGALDTSVTQTNRQRLIEELANQPHAHLMECRVENSSEIQSYAGWRPGRMSWQIGPCIADNPGAGLLALNQSLEMLTGEEVSIDIPVENTAAIRWAEDNRFREQRRFIRMYLGRKLPDQPDRIFASFGPEKG